MSWQPYIDSLMGSGNLNNSAICGLDGSLWATSSPSFKPKPEEVMALIAGFADKNRLTNGVIVGQKYMYLQSDDNQIQGKKGACGISIAKTQQCILIGTYDEGKQAGNARKAVEDIKDHLVSKNY